MEPNEKGEVTVATGQGSTRAGRCSSERGQQPVQQQQASCVQGATAGSGRFRWMLLEITVTNLR
jgi:hypothetical protein